jgi:Zn-dependent protease
VRDPFAPSTEQIFAGQTNDNFELLKAWAASSLAYAISRNASDVTAMLGGEGVQDLIIAGVVCGLAFVLHELAHRVVARRFGAEAHFVANNAWLLISIAVAFAGWFIAAPGAVWHRGLLTKRQGGLIALAGPATNLVLSVLFFGACALFILNLVDASPFVQNICYAGFVFNAWLGVFNMIPSGPFDGAKVLAWSPLVFGVTVAIGIGLAFGLTNPQVQNSLRSLVLSLS